MRAGRALRWLLAVAVIGAGAGCARSARVRYQEGLATAAGPERHAIHGERLVELMRGLDRLLGDRLPQAMDLRGERERRAREIAEVAVAMAASAEQIPDAALGAQGGEDRARLRELAEELRRRSLALAEASRAPAPELLRARVASVEATCDACHRRFRLEGR